MHKNSLTAHCLVRNEERWIWYAINSVINHVDRILVFDTGSTDATVKIIKSIRSPKIVFEQKGVVDKKSFVALRQEMLDRTKTGWFMVLDGDEIWPEAAIKELVNTVKHSGKTIHAVVARQWSCLGDVFHYSKPLVQVIQPFAPPGYSGFCMPRAFKKIPGLHCIGEYGYESYADRNGVNISFWKSDRFKFLQNKYWHLTFLQRSSSAEKDKQVMMRQMKTLYYSGVSFPENIIFPEVFYLKRPAFVPDPWKKFTWRDYVKGWYYRTILFMHKIL